MAIEEVLNSFKAKMYDYVYSPFFSSYIIAWILINYQFVLILISEKKIDEKLNWIKDNPCSYYNFYWYPLAIALIYVFIYPWISLGFYKYTLARDNDKKRAKLLALKQKPYPYAEAIKLIDDLKKYQEEIEEVRRENLINSEHLESKYELKINDFEKQISNLTETIENLSNEKRELLLQLNKYQGNGEEKESNEFTDENENEFDDIMKYYIKLNKYINETENKFITKNVIQKLLDNSISKMNEVIQLMVDGGMLFPINSNKFLIIGKTYFSKNELLIMKFLYDNNFSSFTHDNLIQIIIDKLTFKRVQAETLIRSLLEKKVLQNFSGVFSFAHDSKTLLLDLFDENIN